MSLCMYLFIFNFPLSSLSTILSTVQMLSRLVSDFKYDEDDDDDADDKNNIMEPL